VIDGSVETVGDPVATNGAPPNSLTRIFSADRFQAL
jgi:hypothetical protein